MLNVKESKNLSERPQANEVAYFEWSVPGFRWDRLFLMKHILRVDYPRTPTVVLVPDYTTVRRVYRPLEDEPDLFTVFAGLDGSADAIIAFRETMDYSVLRTHTSNPQLRKAGIR